MKIKLVNIISNDKIKLRQLLELRLIEYTKFLINEKDYGEYSSDKDQKKLIPKLDIQYHKNKKICTYGKRVDCKMNGNVKTGYWLTYYKNGNLSMIEKWDHYYDLCGCYSCDWYSFGSSQFAIKFKKNGKFHYVRHGCPSEGSKHYNEKISKCKIDNIIKECESFLKYSM